MAWFYSAVDKPDGVASLWRNSISGVGLRNVGVQPCRACEIGLTFRRPPQAQRRDATAIEIVRAARVRARRGVVIVPRVLKTILLQSDHGAAIQHARDTGPKAQARVTIRARGDEIDTSERPRPAPIVGGLDLTGPECEGQELIPGPPELVLDHPGQVAGCRGVEDILEGPFQGASPCGDGRDGEGLDVAGQAEGLVQPQLEPHRQNVVAGLDRIGDIAGQMSQAGLVRIGVALLRHIAIRTPDLGAVAAHHVADHHFGAAENPVVGVAALDPHTGLVRADHPGPAQPGDGDLSPILEAALRPAQHVHQAALADPKAEQVGERPFEPLCGATIILTLRLTILILIVARQTGALRFKGKGSGR